MRLLGAKILATRYERPERVGALFLNPAYLLDTSRSLWSVVMTTDAANAALGVVLEPEWIVVTAPNSGVFFETDEAGREVFLLAASSVRRIVPWTSDGASVLAPGHVLVRTQRKAEETRGALFVVRSDEPAGSCTGEVVAVGSGVRDVVLGDRVVVSVHAGVETELGGERLLTVDVESVLALV